MAATAGSGSNCTGSGLSRVLFHAPDLTVATESPSYPPWFVADDPANGQGFESAMTYALAGQLGIARNRVIWVAEPFGDAVTPGPKAFDFDVDQIGDAGPRSGRVVLSPLLPSEPGAGGPEGEPHHHGPLSGPASSYTYGAQAGTTGLAAITEWIKPTHPPVSFATLDEAVAALRARRIDVLVADGPTAQHISPTQDLVIAAQLPTSEPYALAFEPHNPLVSCVNRALSTLQANGTLARLQRKYLGRTVSAPTVKP